MIDVRVVRCSMLGLATVFRRRIGGGENTGYDSGLVARWSNSDEGGDSKDMRRGSRYASNETVMSADDGDGGPPADGGTAGSAGRIGRGWPFTGDGGTEASLRGV